MKTGVSGCKIEDSQSKIEDALKVRVLGKALSSSFLRWPPLHFSKRFEQKRSFDRQNS
jgi:hypothetical protein